jgi:hypothetical protein
MPAYPGHRASFLWVNAAFRVCVDGPDDADVGPLILGEPPGDVDDAARMRVNAHLRVCVMSPDDADVGPLPHLGAGDIRLCVARRPPPWGRARPGSCRTRWAPVVETSVSA